MKGKDKRYLLNGFHIYLLLSILSGHYTGAGHHHHWPGLLFLRSLLYLATPCVHTYNIFIQTHTIIPTHPGHSQDHPIIFHMEVNHVTTRSKFFNSSPVDSGSSPKFWALPMGPSITNCSHHLSLISSQFPFTIYQSTSMNFQFLKSVALSLTSRPSPMLFLLLERNTLLPISILVAFLQG